MRCMDSILLSSVSHGVCWQQARFWCCVPVPPATGPRSRYFIWAVPTRVNFPGIRDWDREKGELELEPLSSCWRPSVLLVNQAAETVLSWLPSTGQDTGFLVSEHWNPCSDQRVTQTSVFWVSWASRSLLSWSLAASSPQLPWHPAAL